MSSTIKFPMMWWVKAEQAGVQVTIHLTSQVQSNKAFSCRKRVSILQNRPWHSIFFSASVFSHIILCGHRDNHFSWIWGLVLGFSWYSCCPLTLCPQPALLKGHTVATVLLFMCQCVMLCCFEFLSDFFYFVDHVIILKLVSKRNNVSSLSYSKVLNLNNSTKNGDFFLSFLLICKTCLMLKIHFKIEKKIPFG